MADAHANFAYSTVATAPSPASSGTSLVVTAGQGALFPAVPFNATVWPANTQPLSTNAEIVRVTARSTDTLTITRAQESSSARTVVVGDQIAATVTKKTMTDAESTSGMALIFPPAAAFFIPAGFRTSGAGGPSTDGRLSAVPFVIGVARTISQVDMRANVVGGGSSVIRGGLYADTGAFAPGALITEFGTIPTNASTSTQSITSLSTALAANTVYWVAGVPQGGGGAAPQAYGLILSQLDSTPASFGDQNANSGFIFSNSTASRMICMTETGVSGALPSTFTSSPGYDTAAVCVVMKV